MAAHRYWRAVGLEACGAGDLELSAFHLLAAGIRVDAPATLTSNAAPDVSGALEDLQDDVLTTAPRWSAQAVKTLILQWDFGVSPVGIDDIRLAGDNEARFLLIVKLQWSDDNAAWTDSLIIQGVKYPGSGVKTLSDSGGDADYSKVALLLHGDGANEAAVITDSSASPMALTVAGSARTSTTKSKFGGSSIRVDGVSGHLYTQNVSKLRLSSVDFTIETWLNVDGLNVMQICGQRSDIGGYGWGLFAHSTGGVFLQCTTGDPNYALTSSKIIAGQWHHIAATRQGNAVRVFIDGVLEVTNSTLVIADDTSAEFAIGCARSGPQYPLYGYIDDLRITVGLARYTESFTPPIAPFPTKGGILLNTVGGRVAPGEPLFLGIGPAITYGTPAIAPPVYLGVETGSVKDYVSGVLGQGIGRVRGTVKEKATPNAPVHRKVRLIRERDNLLIREVWSDRATGEYDFRYVDEAQTYTVLSYDHLHNYRAVVADNLTPELMP